MEPHLKCLVGKASVSSLGVVLSSGWGVQSPLKESAHPGGRGWPDGVVPGETLCLVIFAAGTVTTTTAQEQRWP